ncbi:MAG: hypothetical protein ACTHJM_08435 [Marmoricola sp.]
MSDSLTHRKALTYIICALIVVLGLPAGASAVGGSNTFIADASTVHAAHVNSAGQLQVTTGGSRLKVGGTVRANGYPAKPFTLDCTGGDSAPHVACATLVPPGETFVIQSLQVVCNSSVSTPVVPSVEAHTPTGSAVPFYPVPGPDSRDGGYYVTSSQLAGTEYVSWELDFVCDGNATASPSGTWTVYGIAQGYLYP